MRKFLNNHLALMTSAVAAVTIVLKIWTVAHGNLTGIAALVSAGGLTSVLGALLAGLPALGTACLLAALVFLPEAIREGDHLRGPLIGTGVALTVGFFLAPEAWFLIGLALFVGMTLSSLLAVGVREAWSKRSRRKLPFFLRKSDQPQRISAGSTFLLIALLGWGAVASSDRPWLPPEEIRTTTAKTITGYVIDSSSGLLLMREHDRSILRIPDREVARRTVCGTDASSPRSLASRILWSEEVSYPRCTE